MAYPGGPMSNHGYQSDGSSNHYPKAAPNEVHLQMKPRPVSQFSQDHEYETLPFDRPKLKDQPHKVRLSSYSVDNDDYAYSVGGTIPASMASMPSTNSLDWVDRDSRAQSAISIISDKPRKRENPIYGSVGQPANRHSTTKSIRTEDEEDAAKSSVRCLWILLITFIVISVILLVVVIVLIVMMLGNATKDELRNYNSTVGALEDRLKEMELTVKAITDPSDGGDGSDFVLMKKIQANVTLAQDDIIKIDTKLDDHSKAAVANFTDTDTKIGTIEQNIQDTISAVQTANTKSDNVRTDFDNFAKSLSVKNCEYEITKVAGRFPLRSSINSGIVKETEDTVIVGVQCSVGGSKMQSGTLRQDNVQNDLSRTQYWCLCSGDPNDATEMDRECRIHVLRCKAVLQETP